MTYPKRVIIETDYTCNLQCRICGLWHNNYRKLRGEEKGLDLSRFDSIFKRLFNDGVKRISFIGGEPFLKSYFLDMVRLAKRSGFLISTVTNGSLLNEDIIFDIVNNGLFEDIIFSLDGYNKNHDIIRGEGVYKTVEKNILYLNSLKRRFNKRFPSVMIYFTVSSYNFKNIEEDVSMLIKLNPSKIRLQLASYVSKDIRDKTNKILNQDFVTYHSYSVDTGVDNDVIDEVKIAVKNLKKKHGGRIVSERIIDSENKSCDVLFKTTVITPSGNILPCPMMCGFIIGNINEISLRDAFNINYEKILMLKKYSENGLPICSQCCVEKVII